MILQNDKIVFSLKSASMFFCLLSLSFLFGVLTDNGFVFSIYAGMSVLVCLSALFFFHVFKYQHFPFLLCLFIVLLLMPFLHITEYLLDGTTFIKWNIFGLTACPFVRDLAVVERTLSLAIAGVMGLCLGVLLFKSFKFDAVSKKIVVPKTFNLPVYIFVTFLCFFLSYIYAPQLSLLEADYGHGVNFSFFKKINFNGSWQLSYAFLILLLLDIWNDKVTKRRIIKYIIFTVNFFTIVLWLQFMRGDRECFGVIVAVVVLFLIKIKISKVKIITCGLLFIVFVFLLQYLGAARSQMHLLGRWPNLKESRLRICTGPWSGALRSPVSVAGDFYYEGMEEKNGRTMLSLFLTIIPGPIARAFNIERPVEGTHGPAWEMRYGIGGTHCVVVPYMDFGIYGVLFFLTLYGFIFAFIESLMDSPSMSKKLLYGCMFTCLPFFIWYGELSFIRGIMAWMIVYGFYLLLPTDKAVYTLK